MSVVTFQDREVDDADLVELVCAFNKAVGSEYVSAALIPYKSIDGRDIYLCAGSSEDIRKLLDREDYNKLM